MTRGSRGINNAVGRRVVSTDLPARAVLTAALSLRRNHCIVVYLGTWPSFPRSYCVTVELSRFGADAEPLRNGRITLAPLPAPFCQNESAAYCSNRSGGSTVRRATAATLGRTLCNPDNPGA